MRPQRRGAGHGRDVQETAIAVMGFNKGTQKTATQSVQNAVHTRVVSTALPSPKKKTARGAPRSAHSVSRNSAAYGRSPAPSRTRQEERRKETPLGPVRNKCRHMHPLVRVADNVKAPRRP